MATIDATKYLTPEQRAKIANTAFGPGTIEVPKAKIEAPLETKIEAPLETKIQGETLAKPATLLSPEVSKEQRVANYTQQQASEAKAAERNLYQQMIDERRKRLEKERTDAIRLATFNSLGNALRTMVQPVGWAVGGSTAGVQPYDDRQYLDAFNRAVKASDEIRNLGKEDMAYNLNLATRDTQRKENEADYQRRRVERIMDAELGLVGKKGKDIHEDRITDAVSAWTIHNNGMTLSQYLDNIEAQFGTDYFGGKRLTGEQIAAVEEAVAKDTAKGKGEGKGEVVKPGDKPTDTGDGNNGGGDSPDSPADGLTDAEKKILATWGKYDINNDGELDKSERDAYNSNRGSNPKMTNASRTIYKNAAKKVAVSKPATGKGGAHSIMKQN